MHSELRHSLESRDRTRRRVLPRLALLFALLSAGSPATAGDRADRGLVDQLRKGGFVLYVRHFETNRWQVDSDPLNLENVAAQRQLTDAGRAQAVAVGAAFRALAIPIDRVICSQFQRAHESARLMDVGVPVPSADVTSCQSARTQEEKEDRKSALRKLLSTPPPPGKNTLIVAHNSNLREAAGGEFADVAEGEVVVFQPGAGGTFRKVARVSPPSTWTDWSKPAR